MDGVLSKPLSYRTLCGLLGVSPSKPPSRLPSTNPSPHGSFHAKTLPSPPTAPTAASVLGVSPSQVGSVHEGAAAQQRGVNRGASIGWEAETRIRSRDGPLMPVTAGATAVSGALASQSGTAAAQASAQVAAQASAFDLAALLRTHDGDEASARRVVTAFHGQGTAPLDGLLAAVRKGEAPAVQAKAHALKGMCDYAGAPALRGAAAALELAAKQAAADAGAERSPPPPPEFAHHVVGIQAEFERLAEAHRAYLVSADGGVGATSAFSPNAANRC